MASTTKTPKLTLEACQLGNAERYDAAFVELVTNRRLYITYPLRSRKMYVALFAGRRPTQEEIESGFYHFLGTSTDAHMLGIYELPEVYTTTLSAVPEILYEGKAPHDPSLYPHSTTPADPNELQTGTGDMLHLVYPRTVSMVRRHHGSYAHNHYGRYVAPLTGEGNAPSWGLIAFYDTPSYNMLEQVFASHNSATYNRIMRRDGKEVYITTAQVTDKFNNYITVGSLDSDPSANLVLRDHEAYLKSEARNHLTPFRLRMKAPHVTLTER